MNHNRTVAVILAAAGLLLAGCSSSPPVADGRPRRQPRHRNRDDHGQYR
ncbi:hypothetical protein [Streptomyces sp. NPDC059928]